MNNSILNSPTDFMSVGEFLLKPEKLYLMIKTKQNESDMGAPSPTPRQSFFAVLTCKTFRFDIDKTHNLHYNRLTINFITSLFWRILCFIAEEMS